MATDKDRGVESVQAADPAGFTSPTMAAQRDALYDTRFWTRSAQFLASIRHEPGFPDLVHALGMLYLSKFGRDYPPLLREELFKKGKELFGKIAQPLRAKYQSDFINTFEVFYNKLYSLESYPENMRDAKRLEVSVMLENDFGPLIKFVELDRLFNDQEAPVKFPA